MIGLYKDPKGETIGSLTADRVDDGEKSGKKELKKLRRRITELELSLDNQVRFSLSHNINFVL